MTKLSEETREKISKSVKEHCAIYGSNRKGATMSRESRKKMSDAARKRLKSNRIDVFPDMIIKNITDSKRILNFSETKAIIRRFLGVGSMLANCYFQKHKSKFLATGLVVSQEGSHPQTQKTRELLSLKMKERYNLHPVWNKGLSYRQQKHSVAQLTIQDTDNIAFATNDHSKIVSDDWT